MSAVVICFFQDQFLLPQNCQKYPKRFCGALVTGSMAGGHAVQARAIDQRQALLLLTLGCTVVAPNSPGSRQNGESRHPLHSG